MPAKTVVSTIFAAKDRVSGAFKKMTRNSKKFGNTTDKAFKKASRSANKFKGITRGILGAGAITKGLSLIQQGVSGVTSEFVTFDSAATKAASKFPEGIMRGTEAFKELEASARSVGATTQFTATEAAEGLDFLAMAGFTAEQAMSTLPGVVNLATVADMDLARSTDIASDALGAFGLMTKDTTKLTENLTRVNDVFAKTVTTSNTDIEMLFEAMKDGGPVMTTAGQSIESFAALTGTMASSGIKGSKAGTTLKNAILNLIAPVGKGEAAIEKMNLKVKDQSGNMRDIIDILADVEKGTAAMGNAQKSATLEAIFGKRAIAGVSVLLAKGSGNLKEYRAQLEGAGGASKDMADRIRGSLSNRLKSLQSALIEVGFKFIEAFEDKFPGAIDKAIEAVRNFNMKAVTDGIKTAIVWFDKLTPVIAGAAAAMVVLTIASNSAKIALAALAVGKLIAFFGVLTTVVASGGSAMAVFNFILAANPIGAIAVGVGLLIAVIVLLVKNWDKVTAAFKKGFNFLKEKISLAWDWFKRLLDNPFFAAAAVILLPWLAIPTLIIKNWEKIKVFMLGLWGFLKDSFWGVVTKIGEGLKFVWDWFLGLLDNPFIATLSTIFLPIITIPALIIKHWEPIKNFFLGIWEFIKGVFNEGVLVVEGFFTTVFDGIKSVFNSVVSYISEKMNWLIGKFKPFLAPLMKLIGSGASAVSNAASAVGGAISGAGGAGKGVINEIFARGEKEINRAAPNQNEVAARNEQQGSFNGKLTIEGAPAGSKLEQKSKGTPTINAELLGAN